MVYGEGSQKTGRGADHAEITEPFTRRMESRKAWELRSMRMALRLSSSSNSLSDGFGFGMEIPFIG
jgi:hypothetical protein